MEHYTVYSEVVSKKNNKEICRRGNKSFLISSKRFRDWHEQAVPQIMAQKPGKKVYDHNCKIYIEFYHDSYRRKDADNGQTSIFDLLVDCGVLVDDNWQILPRGMFENYYDKLQPRAEIYIYDKDEETGIVF